MTRSAPCPASDTHPARPGQQPRPVLAGLHLAVAGAIVVLVLAQAALAGQHLFYGEGITLHGILGNTTFALTVVGVVLAVVRRLPAAGFALAVALLSLTFAQVGLGYLGRTSQPAAAWHVPLGVLIFGVATFQLAVLGSRVRGAPPGR